MPKPIFVLNKLYKSNVKHIEKVNEKYTVVTNDDRFFSFGQSAMDLLSAVQGCEESGSQDIETKYLKFFQNVLVDKGIYLEQGKEQSFQAKKPGLTAHFQILPETLVNKACNLMTWIFNPFVALVLVVVSATFFARYLTQNVAKFNYDFVFSYTPTDILFVVAFGLLNSFVHEFGHATACRKFAGKAGEIGVGINFVILVFYANVSYVHILSKWKRALVGISGVYFQLILGLCLIYFAADYPQIHKFLILFFISILFNLVPFFRNDGFWILNDVLGKQNLMQEVFQFLGRKRRFEIVYLVYGTLLALFSIAITFVLVRFALFRGPDMVNNYLTSSQADFTLSLKFILALSHYGIIVFALISLASLLIQRVKQGNRIKNEKALLS